MDSFLSRDWILENLEDRYLLGALQNIQVALLKGDIDIVVGTEKTVEVFRRWFISLQEEKE